jgi:hypothetical protein
MMLQRDGRDFKPDRFMGAVLGLRLGCAVMSALALTSAAAFAGAAALEEQKADAASVAFNIPSQPLGAALETYARLSSHEVLYDAALAAGRRSSLVDGVYTPEVALQILLAGTGLWADFKDADFFVVGLSPDKAPAQMPAAARTAENTRYYGRLQASLKTAFCGNIALPEGDRVAARLWIGQRGRVLQVKSLSSTGSGELDRTIDEVLHGLNLDGPPPPGFAQPVTVVVMPNATEDCKPSRPPAREAGR